MNATADAHWRWQSAVPLAAPSVNNWLQDTGSLTARLRRHCSEFRVQLLNTRADVPLTQSQANWLGEPQACCREVLLLCDEQPWIYASSLYASAALETLPALDGLGQKALGELLFDNPQLVRSAFEFAQLTALQSRQLALHLLPHPFKTQTDRSSWARRSVLAIPEARVLVSELFLPAACAYRELIL